MTTEKNDISGYCKGSAPSANGIVASNIDVSEDGSNSSDYQIGSRVEQDEKKNTTEVGTVENLKFQQVPISALNEAERELYYQKFAVLLDKSVYFSDFLLTRLVKSVSKSTKKKREQSNNNSSNNSGTNSGGTAAAAAAADNASVVCAGKNDNARKKSRSNDEKENEKTKKAKGAENVAKDTYVNEAGVRVSVRQPKLLTGAVMRDYQLDGLEWLVALFENAVNGILADEMGLGKTIQVIALISHLISKKIYGPFLIVAPLSTLPNWMMEFSKFAPKLNVILYHGTEQRRAELEKEFKTSLLAANSTKKKQSVPPIVLTSYEVPLRDKRFLRAVSWGYLIVDEGHRLKNYRSLLSQELRRYRTESRLLLTGTPLQNNLTELWSLLNFILPSIFNDICMFENMLDCSDLEDTEKQIQLLNEEKEKQLISKMHRIIGPFLLRRLKSDVNISLPRKKELLVYTPLTGEQEQLYKAILNRPSSSWWHVNDGDDRAPDVEAEPDVKSSESAVQTDSGRKRKRRVNAGKTVRYNFDLNDTDDDEDDWCWRNRNPGNGNVDDLTAANKPKKQQQSQLDTDDEEIVYKRNFSQLNVPMQLRKVVNHPYLIRTPINRRTNGLVVDENLIRKSGKCLVLDAMLPKLRERGHKVLLFSTFTMLLDMIEEVLRMRDYSYVRLDGSCAIDHRLNTIKKFNEDPDVFVFLISTRAGGLGINLTSADTVIIYDSDWNPQVDLQAQDRCHRLGQTKPVVVYRLVTAGTIDEEIVKRAAGKRRLEKIIVNEGKFKQGTGRYESISIEELKKLLQSNDYNKVFRTTGNVFSEDDLENLLDRSDLIDSSQGVNVNQLSQQQQSTTGSTTNVFKVVENNFSDIKIG